MKGDGTQNIAVNDPVVVVCEDAADVTLFSNFTVLADTDTNANVSPQQDETVESTTSTAAVASTPPTEASPEPSPIILTQSTSEQTKDSDYRNLRYYTKDDGLSIDRKNWIPGRR